MDALREEVDQLVERARKLQPGAGEEQRQRWRAFFDRYFEVDDRLREATAFARALAATHTDEPEAVRMPSKLEDVQTEFDQVRVQLEATFRDVDDETFQRYLDDERFEDMTLWFKELRRDAGRAMDPAREELAVKLNRDGLHAWGRLYSEVTGRLEVQVETDVLSPTLPDGLGAKSRQAV